MAYSRAYIYNIALIHLALSATIQTVNQTDSATTTFNTFYEIAKNQVLADFDWSFASTFRDLTPTGNKPENPKYQFEYDYPNDCIAAREILDTFRSENAYKFDIGTISNGQKVIYTNISPARLRYTKNVDKESFFTADFVLALGAYLGSLCGKTITGSSSKANNCFQIYQLMINKAKKINATESQNKDEAELKKTWLDERF